MSWTSRFAGNAQEVAWSPRYGIAHGHWVALCAYAAERQMHLLVRGGKEAAIPWIRQQYPGKPMDLGFLKVDPELGLLIAPEKERPKVFALGHYVLTASGGPGAYVAVRARGSHREQLSRTFTESELRRVSGRSTPLELEGVVVDALTKLPFTSDYDLAAVVGAGEGFNYYGTFGSMSAAVVGARPGEKRDLTNLYVEQVRAELNHRVGRRFLHGSNVQYYGDDAIGTSFGNKPGEEIIVFSADHRAYVFTAAGGLDGPMQVVRALVAMHPDKAHVFNQ